MDIILKYFIFSIILLILMIMISLSNYMIYKVNNDEKIDDNKILISIYTIIFISNILYIGYLLYIQTGNDFKKLNVALGAIMLVSIILSLIFMIERNKTDVIGKNYVAGSLSYIIFTLYILMIQFILSHSDTINGLCGFQKLNG